MTHDDQIFNSILGVVSVSRIHFVVMTLDDQVFDSRSDLNAIVVSVYREVLYVISDSLMAVVLIDGV